MRKFLIGLVIALVVIGGGLYAGSAFLTEKASREVMAYLIGQGKDLGFDIVRADFQSARPGSFSSVVWNNFAMTFHLFRGNVPDRSREYSLRIQETKLGLDVPAKTLTLSGRGINVVSSAAGDESGRLSGERLNVYFRMDALDPPTVARKVRAEARRALDEVLKSNRTAVPVDFEGRAVFKIGRVSAEADLRMEPRAGQSTLVMDKGDLRVISGSLKEKLTDAEVDFLSGHPVQTPQLLRIKERAQDESQRAHQTNASVPEDAYRHVLWSYLLTRDYGEAFAKEVTDAHEAAPANTEADRRMDTQNNAVGRRYAAEDLEESQILGHLLADPDVVHAP
ncbi:MAG: DUF6973 domain-containing protein [Candidatus Omnitrophota bacterium]